MEKELLESFEEVLSALRELRDVVKELRVDMESNAKKMSDLLGSSHISSAVTNVELRGLLEKADVSKKQHHA